MTPEHTPPRAPRDDFYLGPNLVQPGRNLISGTVGETRVEPMAMRVLLCLAASPGVTLSRETLNRLVWEGRAVSDKVLTRAISNLRLALGDDPRHPEIIETVSKMGYRLLVDAVATEPEDLRFRAESGTGKVPTARPGPRVRPAHRRFQVRVPLRVALLLMAGLLALVWFLSRPSPNQKLPPLFPNGPSQAVTTYPGHELRPRLSPLGDRLVFARRGSEDENWDIYLQHVRNGEPHRLTDHPDADLSPAWSPDGSRIAYFRFGEDSCGIFVQAVPGGSAQKVSGCYRIPFQEIAMVAPKLEWTPDGKSIAFCAAAGEGEGPLRIALLDLESGETRFITRPPENYVGDLDPAISPDGRFLAVCRIRNWSDRDLVVVDRQNGAEVRVTFDSSIVLGHDWSRDGERLLFSSNRDGGYRLWSVARSGGPLDWMPVTGGYLKHPSLARGSPTLVYESWQYDTNIWLYPAQDRDAPGPSARVASTRWDFQPDYSDLNQRVAFVSNRGGAFQVWRAELDGTRPVQITRFEEGTPGAPRWAPDGKALVFHVWREGTADLFLWKEGDGPARPLFETRADELFADWSPDGRWLYFTSNAESGWQLWRAPITGGSPERLTSQGGYFAQPTLDGEALIYTRQGDLGVWRVPAVGGEPDRLFSLDAHGDWGHLAVVDDGVFFIRRDADYHAWLWFYDFQTRSEEVRRILGPNLAFHEPGLAAPRDGAWILLSQIDQTESDIHFTPLIGPEDP